MTQDKRNFQLLVVDDDPSLREFLTIMLEREGYRVTAATDALTALKVLRSGRFDLILSDIKMPGMSGVELLDVVTAEAPETIVVMMTAFSSTEDAVDAMKRGAYDYIVKPCDNDELRLVISNALERKALKQENVRLKKELNKLQSFSGLVGKSKAMRAVYDLIDKVADNRVSVLITGESGTGKEIVARTIHQQSSRKNDPFIAVNCGAIPENLLESELFGYEKGAFTGAERQKSGLMEEAEGGTLFLDEIGELPQLMQVKLLRVLQESEVRRVGGSRSVKLDFRLLTATNKNLTDEVAAGRFREDLYYRLNVIELRLPPLRDKKEDIPQLIKYFCARRNAEDVVVAEDALRCLTAYHWPGNVRELENVVERCLVLGQTNVIEKSCLPVELVSPCASPEVAVHLPADPFDLDAYLLTIEKSLLLAALQEAGGVRKKAAARLGMTFRSIRYRLAKFDLDREEEVK
ncbi:MAG: sigma-54 dependent transcriptional regulator [Desulfuromonadales bacterium]|nr:sigma-54 dependent transcriptional regulator [Desulfuromonadales bacterium]